ncbi:hybrid sensor histidine kinase/response regulator [Sphingomonas bacterium]|uniref:hybrid sensor histidine kinase/response regulator n=1 Tax=Sphingomonas bacterium TaxID=1895847 RepID=UPI001576EA59|nr:ATP-binding protein [Sphingomonas bacterium]
MTRSDTAEDAQDRAGLSRSVVRSSAGSPEAYAELRRAMEAAEAANEAKTRYLVSVSHEIRSPLNAIYGYAQLLERGGDIPCDQAGAVIRRSAEHLANLVESLLEISRIESGVITIRSDVVDIRALLDQVIDMFRVQAAAKDLSFDLTIAAPLPAQVKTDEKRLRQILINLVSNAIKYTPAGGVKITVGYRSQVADIEVSDTGIGIAGDELDRVFQPFERGASPEAQLQPGIGLGLAISRMLAQVMGGDITAGSEPGVGSSFRLKLMLPRPTPTASPEGAPKSERIAGYEGEPRTVLVVDDDPAQTAVLQSLLRPLGFVVYAAGDGPDGIALAAHCSADIVLLDVQMPGLSGWETARQLRATHGAALKIVMVSADLHAIDAQERGCHDAFVAKPVDLDALLALIGTQLDLRWTKAAPSDTAAAPAMPVPLPREALPFIARLRQAASIGHVRAIDDGLRELRAAVPAASGLAAMLERQLDEFDLRSLLKTLDDAAR